VTPPEAAAGFTVKLTNFEGPFDLLLQLISRHKLDVTEVALSAVTDEFIAHLRALGSDWDLDQTSSFLVVAATLLDLKAARLLPAGEVEDAEDIAMLEARDLLFARLLQYRAFKQVSTLFRGRLEAEGRRHPRPGGLEEAYATLLPEVVLTVDGEQLAWLAARALQPKPEDAISLAHLHAPAVSVREQAHLIVTRVREVGSVTFRALVADAGDRLVVVARFLALLELARQRAVAFDQLAPLGELTVRWTASDAAGYEASHIDEFTGVPPQGEHHE
jgi:segregation and condensation protein A